MYRWNSSLVLAAFLSLTSACASGQSVKKDVPYVPTPEPVVAEMLRLADVKEGEKLYDLGCGDGRIVVTAAKKFGAKGVGVDIDPQRIEESNANAKKEGVEDKVKFATQNLFDLDFKDADVVTLYLLTTVNAKLRPKLLDELRPGARVVSHAFSMGDWKPDQQVTVQPGGQTVYFWVIPAKAGGTWNGTIKSNGGQEQQAVLDLKQNFQEVSGTATIGDQRHALRDVKLKGDQLTFSLGEQGGQYSCRIDGGKMNGKNGADGDAAKELVATRQ